MSLGVVVKGPEGIVLSADSRVTLTAQMVGQPPLVVNFDNATKLLAFSGSNHRHVGAVTYGAALIESRTVHSFMPEVELSLPEKRLCVREYAEGMKQFFDERYRLAGMTPSNPGDVISFIVAGYDEKAAYGRVFVFAVPDGNITERNPDDFGMTWGGQLEVAARLIHGMDPNLARLYASQAGTEPEQVSGILDAIRPHLEWKVPYQVLPLQDCVDVATFLIRATMTAQSVSIGIRGVGGVVEVATVTEREGLKFVRQKTISYREV